MADNRFVILVLDGLRPDLITPETMPNLSAFRDASAVLGNCRAQYPSHTRVNKVSFATGSAPHRHGIHFNKIYVPELSSVPLDIGNYDDVRTAYAAGELITAPTIGRVLAGAGRRFSLVHCGFSGAPWLLNYRGDEVGMEHLATAGYQFSTPALAAKVEARMGEMPRAGGINLERTSFAIKAFQDIVYPELLPDVSLIWSDEPDKSFHSDGLRGPLSAAAIAHVDHLVGDMVAWWRSIRDRDNLNLLIVSDHGHIEISGRVALGPQFAGSGLPVTLDPAEAGALLLPFGSGGLHLRGESQDTLADIVAWMQKQPWCGTLFTADVDGTRGIIPGTFSTALASIDHPRAPDLLFTTRRFDADGDDHPLGHCTDVGTNPPAGSTHGGLHREELANTFTAAGPAFREAYRSETVGGLIDLVPTMLSQLGVGRPESMTGRPLDDLLRTPTGEGSTAVAPPETVTVEAGNYMQHLTFRRLAQRNVVDHALRA